MKLGEIQTILYLHRHSRMGNRMGNVAAEALPPLLYDKQIQSCSGNCSLIFPLKAASRN